MLAGRGKWLSFSTVHWYVLTFSTVCSFGNHGAKKGHKTLGVFPTEGYKDGESSRAEDIRGEAEVPWFVQPGEEDEGRLHQSLQLPHVGSRGVWADLLSLLTTIIEPKGMA